MKYFDCESGRKNETKRDKRDLTRYFTDWVGLLDMNNHTHTHIHSHTHTYTYIYTYTYLHTYIHIYMSMYI